MDLTTMKMSVKRLRTECPQFEWKAEKYGMGYRYIGTFKEDPESKAEVFATARLVGMSDDEFMTEWRVNTPYAPYSLPFLEFKLQCCSEP